MDEQREREDREKDERGAADAARCPRLHTTDDHTVLLVRDVDDADGRTLRLSS
jgi:hypothetical protein